MAHLNLSSIYLVLLSIFISFIAGAEPITFLPECENGNNCDCIKSNTQPKRINVCSDIFFPEQLELVGYSIHVKNSNILIDCAGSTLKGEGVTGIPNSNDIGLRVAGHELQDVHIQNCHFSDFNGKGLRLIPPNITMVINGIYRPLRRFTITNVTVDSSREGIYIGTGSEDFLIDQVSVSRTYSAGIYLEHDSKNTTIQYSFFYLNGSGFGVQGSYPNREDIAIDSSYHNTVRHNLFYGNKRSSYEAARSAAVRLYKNCGERGITRKNGSDSNIITHNNFYNYAYTAVHIASRQGMKDPNANNEEIACTDQSYYVSGLGDRYRDYAKYNRVENNIFLDNFRSVVIHDDLNFVIRNSFNNSTEYDVAVASEFRKLLGQPIGYVMAIDNTSDAGNNKLRAFHDSELIVSNRGELPEYFLQSYFIPLGD
ncbi:MAG: hypothetical protein QNJ97_20630 [Myxococcota bacterium]|nr:hypothetical protein [Myxococcota bacterium]